MRTELSTGRRTPDRPPRASAPRATATGVAAVGVDLSGAVIAWNGAAEQLFGWTRTELRGRRLPIVPREEWTDFQRALEAADADAPISTQRAHRQHRDGRAMDVEVSTLSIHDRLGRVTGLIELISPLPTSAHQQPMSTGNPRMEAVGRLAGGVAHDFNNILTAIAGYASLLAADLPRDDPRQADVAEIRKATERATRLTRQLLAFGRRDSQDARELDLNDVVSDIMPMLRQLIGEHIELLTNAAVGLPAILADHTQMEQILVNLVLNARDAMPHGGRLVVGTAPVTLDAGFVAARPGSRLGPHVRLVVEDTGSGMPADVLTHIFEPYFTTKEPGRGTGLGLSTVYGIVKQSGGYISAESAPGRGTTISVYLPVHTEAD